MDEDREKMEYALEQFTEYVQTTFDFNNTAHLVLLSNELRLVKAYLEIEKLRFSDRLTVVWDINFTTKVSIPPLSIQTLVENAVNHGLMVRNSPGVLTVKVMETNNHVIITIKDNGVGMSKEKLNEVTTSKVESGVGIYNVNRRLKQLFNLEMEIESKENEGTTITIKLPI